MNRQNGWIRTRTFVAPRLRTPDPDLPSAVDDPFEVGGHLVRRLGAHRSRRLVCLHCSGEADDPADYVDKPCPRN